MSPGGGDDETRISLFKVAAIDDLGTMCGIIVMLMNDFDERIPRGPRAVVIRAGRASYSGNRSKRRVYAVGTVKYFRVELWLRKKLRD